MVGQVIGKTMLHGYAGSYSRQPDMVVDTAPAEGTIPFGFGVVYGNTGVKLPESGAKAADFVGVALREVKSATDYLNQNEGQYNAYDAVPVIKRGCVNVHCQNGTPARGAAVYLRVAANAETYPKARVGGFEAAADSTNSVALTNVEWAGTADANGIAEIRIKTILKA